MGRRVEEFFVPSTSAIGPLPQFVSAKRASAMKGSAVAGVAGKQMHERRSLTAYTHVFESLLGIRTGAQNGVSQIAKCPLQNNAAKIER